MNSNLQDETRLEAGLTPRLTQELSKLEKRDGEFWLIIAVSGIVGGCILLCLAFPSAFFQKGELHLEVMASRHLLFVILALLVVLNTYLVTRCAELRGTRRNVVATTIQAELVRAQSFIDPLTEVYNRRSLGEMAARFISRARRSKQPLTFLLLDVDRFREVNARFGHITGDFVLTEIARLLRRATRGTDAVVRYGGDEFLIILANTSRANSAVVVRRIVESVENWNKSGDLENFVLSVSIGVAEWSEGETLDEILDAADREMYAIKDGARSTPRRRTE